LLEIIDCFGDKKEPFHYTFRAGRVPSVTGSAVLRSSPGAGPPAFSWCFLLCQTPTAAA
jgi:hypothetical protein